MSKTNSKKQNWTKIAMDTTTSLLKRNFNTFFIFLLPSSRIRRYLALIAAFPFCSAMVPVRMTSWIL